MARLVYGLEFSTTSSANLVSFDVYNNRIAKVSCREAVFILQLY